jgi:hypothetical protein
MTSDELSMFAKRAQLGASIGSTFPFQLIKFCQPLVERHRPLMVLPSLGNSRLSDAARSFGALDHVVARVMLNNSEIAIAPGMRWSGPAGRGLPSPGFSPIWYAFRAALLFLNTAVSLLHHDEGGGTGCMNWRPCSANSRSSSVSIHAPCGDLACRDREQLLGRDVRASWSAASVNALYADIIRPRSWGMRCR